ncbi:MAG: DUF1254 domain-containing protein [Alsobacter sp.]
MRTAAGRLALIVTAGVLLGGIVHLSSVLALPRLASRNADTRLAEMAPRHQVVVVPHAADGTPGLPFQDPAAALAVCRFELSDGPVRVRATPGDSFMAVAFHTPTGGVFYALTDRSAAKGSLEALIVTQAQLEALQAQDPEDEPVRELRLVSPRSTGFVTFRTLALQPGLYPEAEALLKTARCAPEALPQ